MKKGIKVGLSAFFIIFGIIFIGGSFDDSGATGSMRATGIVFLLIAALLVKSIITGEKVIKLDADKYYDNMKAKADAYYSDKIKSADEYSKQKREEANSEADKYYKDVVDSAERKKATLEREISSLNDTLKTLRADTLVEAIDVSAYNGLRSDEIKNELALIKVKEDELVKSGNAYNITIKERKTSDINTQVRQLLRCFNSESSSLIEGISVKNADSVRGKVRRSFDALNKLFAKDGVEISEKYLSLKLEELSLVYAYMLKLDEEKEQKKAIREQLVEEEKVRREIERQKAKIEKEESQFSNEVKKLMGYMQKAKDDIEKQLYIDKIKELEEKLKALAADKEDVLHREQNTRAGFVYIISNIGSFGEEVYKIGMTRRLEPMERIDELSSASVPFKFDVHAMIFSEDAPALEAILHQTFREKQVNKVNPRKEFFRVDLEEIKKIVRENHNATVRFVDIPEAEEYRETLRLEAAASESGFVFAAE